MIGRVKIFYDDKKFGFIIGEDNYEYFFHITDIIGVDLPTSNSIVEFEPSASKRGKQAIQIKVTQKYEQRPQYINLGRNRIKISAIKRFETSTHTEKHYAKHLFKPDECVGETVTYYIYIYLCVTGQYDYCITYNNKSDFLSACKMLDEVLGVVDLNQK